MQDFLMSKIIERGNPSISDYCFITSSDKKILDILDFFFLTSLMKKHCKSSWFSSIDISDNFDASTVNLNFESINDFCYIKLVCNLHYTFERIK